MRLVRVLAVLLAVSVAVVYTLVTYWYIFGGEGRIKNRLISELRPTLGPTFNLGSIGFSPRTVRLKQVTLDPAPSISLKIESIVLHISPYNFLIGSFQKQGAIDEIDLIRPILEYRQTSPETLRTSAFEYQPYLAKRLAPIKLFRRLNLSNGSIRLREESEPALGNLSGIIDLTNPENGRISLTAESPAIEDAELEIEGDLNLEAGTFLLATRIEVPEIKHLEQIERVDKLELTGGRLSAEVQVWGDEALHYTGKLSADKLTGTYAEKWQLSDGAIRGALFGQRIEVEGGMKLNGLQFSIYAEYSDLLNGRWSSRLTGSQLDFSLLSIPEAKLPGLKGLVDLKCDFTGDSVSWSGTAELASSKLQIGTISTNNLNLKLEIDSVGVTVETGEAGLFGGVIDVNGSYRFDSKDGLLNGSFKRKWVIGELPTWCRLATPEMESDFSIQYESGEWKASGQGTLRDGSPLPIVNFALDSRDGSFYLDVDSPTLTSPAAYVIFQLSPEFHYQLNGKEIQEIARLLVKEESLPVEVWNYSSRVEADGDLNSGSIEFDALQAEQGRSLKLSLDYTRDDAEFGYTGELAVGLPGKKRLTGEYSGKVTDNFNQAKLSLRLPNRVTCLNGSLSQQRGRKASGQIKLEAVQLPVSDLAKMLWSQIDPKFSAISDFTVSGLAGDWDWRGQTQLTYADSSRMNLISSGNWKDRNLNLEEFTLESPGGDTVLVEAAGSIDFHRKWIDTLHIALTQFPLKYAFGVATPELLRRLDGLVNARLDLSGPFGAPGIYSDFHLTEGRAYSATGYWANINLVGSDSSYNLKQVEFGNGLKSLLTATGKVDLRDSTEEFTASGREVDLSFMIQALSGVKPPLSGLGSYTVSEKKDSQGRRAVIRASMDGGSAAGIEFERLTSSLTYSERQEVGPVVSIDELKLDCGDFETKIVGEIPLKSEQTLDLKVNSTGKLTGILPKLTNFFTNPRGSGEISLRVGGTLKQPKAVEGRVSLRNCGIEMQSVVGDIANLNADVILDRESSIRIQRLNATIDGAPIEIRSRDADGSGESSIRIGDYDLGVLQLKSGEEGFWIVIPGLMESGWGGYLRLAGRDGAGFFEIAGPASRPVGRGSFALRNTIFTYPLLGGGGKPPQFVSRLLDLLQRMKWDVSVSPYRGCRYFREISGLGEIPGWGTLSQRVAGGLLQPDLKLTLDLRIDDNPNGLTFYGSLKDTMHLGGEVVSSQGSIEVLDMSFDVESVAMRFNPAYLDPFISGVASTTFRDSTGIERQIRIRIGGGSQGDVSSLEESGTVRFDEMILSLEDDQGHSQEQILALLGYTQEGLTGKIGGIGGRLVTTSTPLGRWTMTFERKMEQWTGLDRIAIETNVAQNLIERQLAPTRDLSRTAGESSYWNLFYGSRVTLGKYLTSNLYLAYIGALAGQTETYNDTRIGIQHSWDLSYRLARISNHLLLNYRFEYNELARSSINTVFVRYNWIFSLQKQVRWLISFRH
jgi:hypothetical protein